MSKDEILKLKESGITYKEISKISGIKVSTLKSIVKRNKTAPDTCKCCGRPLVHVAGKKRKMFCSDSCRFHFYRQHKELIVRHMETFVCPVCHKKFLSYKSKNPKFCSLSCYQESRNKNEEGNN